MPAHGVQAPAALAAAATDDEPGATAWRYVQRLNGGNYHDSSRHLQTVADGAALKVIRAGKQAPLPAYFWSFNARADGGQAHEEVGISGRRPGSAHATLPPPRSRNCQLHFAAAADRRANLQTLIDELNQCCATRTRSGCQCRGPGMQDSSATEQEQGAPQCRVLLRMRQQTGGDQTGLLVRVEKAVNRAGALWEYRGAGAWSGG